MPVNPGQLVLFNSLSRKKEPYTASSARMYVCGITPDESTHLGHAFTYVTFDALARYLRQLGKDVTYVRNITDVDDDILGRARSEGKDWKELRDRNTAEFRSCMARLNNIPPDVTPRASEHIKSIDSLNRRLVGKKCAYQREGNVYFRASKANFGSLSRLDESEWLSVANERGNNPGDPLKEHPLDFPLWVRSGPGEPEWESSFGRGRPGWHIECSAMSMEYLGVMLDIHGGGHDLIFPHHEAEIAQAENATGRQFARVWMHVGMLRYEGEKMSKSLGNVVRLPDLLEKLTPNSIRLMLLLHHYRLPWEYTEAEAAAGARLAGVLHEPGRAAVDIDGLRQRFYSALNDDLDTPQAVRVLTGLAAGSEHPAANEALREMAALLGLHVEDGRVAA